MRYCIALGSNVGNRLEYLRAGRAALLKLHENSGKAVEFSSIYLTEPIDCVRGSEHFYNAVGFINSSLDPAELLQHLQAVEAGFGRTPASERPVNAPRALDLDILFADDTLLDTGDLKIPHPRWSERSFVLAPLAELCDDAILGGQDCSVGELLAELPPGAASAAARMVIRPSGWNPDSDKMTPQDLANWTQVHTKTVRLLSLTAYDYPTARILDEAGVDVILVGDSLGMVFAGLPDTTGVTIDHMVYHTEVVCRGVKKALVIGDLPYHSYEDVESTLLNAQRLIDAGADLVKLEGGSGQKHKIAALTEAGIPTVGHLGMLPQRVREEGGYHKKGKSEEGAERLLQGARDIVEAGVSAIVLESVVAEVANQITAAVPVPTIGIGSGKACDGEIRVINDLVGSYPWFVPPFATTYADFAGDLRRAVDAFREEIHRS